MRFPDVDYFVKCAMPECRAKRLASNLAGRSTFVCQPCQRKEPFEPTSDPNPYRRRPQRRKPQDGESPRPRGRDRGPA
jgi:hypothetical protein